MDYLKVQKKAMTDLYKSTDGKKGDRWCYEKIDGCFWLSNGSFAVRIPDKFFLLNEGHKLLGKFTAVIGSVLDENDRDDYKEMFVHYAKTAVVYGKRVDCTCLSNYVPESERFTVNIDSKLIDFFGKPWELTFYAKDNISPVMVHSDDELVGLIMPLRVKE